MAGKITLKNALANLPQKTDVDSIVATDASGNPVYIKKSDLAQVVAELMPAATAGKAGLMSKDFFNIGKRRTLMLSGDNKQRLVKIASLPKNTYIRYIVFVQGFYEISPIMCAISIRSDSAAVFSTVVNGILPIPSYIELYTKEIDNYFNLYIRSTGQSGNTSHVLVTHVGSSSFYEIGEAYDLDSTYKKIEQTV